MTSLYETRPHGIMFHHFHGANHPLGQGSISGEQLSEMIRYLDRKRILSCTEWMERALSNRLREGDLCFTFDDNLRCQYDIAFPVLKSLGITAFWFVYTSVMQGRLENLEIYRDFRNTQFKSIDAFYGRYFEVLAQSEFGAEVQEALGRFEPASYLKDFTFYTDDDRKFRFLRDRVLGTDRYNKVMDRMIEVSGYDVKEASHKLWMDESCLLELQNNGHIIGLHSFSHPTQLATLDRAHQEREYHSNYDYLSKLLGKKPVTMSHPCNSYNGDTMAILQGLKIQLGFRANMVSRPEFGPLEFPREDHANVAKLMVAHSS